MPSSTRSSRSCSRRRGADTLRRPDPPRCCVSRTDRGAGVFTQPCPSASSPSSPSRWRSPRPPPPAPRSAAPTASWPTRAGRAHRERSCSPRTAAAACAGWPRRASPPTRRSPRSGAGSRSPAAARSGSCSRTAPASARSRSAPSRSRDPTWSPAADALAFTTGYAGDRDLYSVSADGNRLRQLTSGRGDDAAPAWGPTGSIAFVRDGDVYLKAARAPCPSADRRRGRRPRPGLVARRPPDRLHPPPGARSPHRRPRRAASASARRRGCASCGSCARTGARRGG